MTGGADVNLLGSTEISTDLGASWTEVNSAALPSPRVGLRAITADNRIFIVGILV